MKTSFVRTAVVFACLARTRSSRSSSAGHAEQRTERAQHDRVLAERDRGRNLQAHKRRKGTSHSRNCGVHRQAGTACHSQSRDHGDRDHRQGPNAHTMKITAVRCSDQPARNSSLRQPGGWDAQCLDPQKTIEVAAGASRPDHRKHMRRLPCHWLTKEEIPMPSEYLPAVAAFWQASCDHPKANVAAVGNVPAVTRGGSLRNTFE